MAQLPVSTYAARGILADIGSIIASDPGFRAEDYYMNVPIFPRLSTSLNL